ncbi:putative polysaccharide biosynthesis protein [Neobacillus thermocopriae]|uniref:Polysaccharide biosynthesis protein n=2 Tax=Neobacillus thermocopriae TaxID=1215031 RepID=A0A6B3TTW2_9BACI|nr:polysaccharide biosynthesis protein [Neobacillus thermocopriae]MED3624593.1 polysaccharide biosynthesis protein [Neobacillus thermocopriae]MED3714565.1 polysaccharide biosynthesis protein [Neobacillus thermocopriae]NEX79970.1 polysaccharide biosynthesis protein [Neobacillus thermocopriae]
MEDQNPSKALFKGAFILTIAAIIVKILSALYRIPFQNIVGDIGFYIYQQIYPFYGIAVVLATTGFPVVISKLYAEQKEEGNHEKSRLLLLISFCYLQVFGLICFLLLYFGANQIAYWMDDPHLYILIRVVSIVFLIFPIVSVLRGYFQGMGDMVPTALSQVGEQSTRVVTILFLSFLFMLKGESLYFVGGGAMVGSVTGSVISVILLFMFLWIRKEWKLVAPRKGMLQNNSQYVKQLIIALTYQGLTICLSGMLLIFIQLADALNLHSLLIASGIKSEMAKGLKGVFDRGQPFIQLGTVAATSMSLTLVPLITRERLGTKPEFLYHKIQLAIKVSIVIGVGASTGLWAIIRPANRMLFENELGSPVLGVLSFAILFTSVIITIISIMQGIGRLIFPAIIITSLLPIKYGLNLFFVPDYGIMGAAVSTVITLGIITFLLFFYLKKLVPIPVVSVRFFGVVFTAAIVMVFVLKGYLFISEFIIATLGSISRLTVAFQSLSAVCLGAMIFTFIIIRKRVFLEEELALFPLGSKLIYFLARKDRG